jgi:hypothetical protein
MYLITTAGRRKEIHIVKQRKDGTFEEKTVIEYESPVGPLSLVVKLFSRLPKVGDIDKE